MDIHLFITKQTENLFPKLTINNIQKRKENPMYLKKDDYYEYLNKMNKNT